MVRYLDKSGILPPSRSNTEVQVQIGLVNLRRRSGDTFVVERVMLSRRVKDVWIALRFWEYLVA